MGELLVPGGEGDIGNDSLRQRRVHQRFARTEIEQQPFEQKFCHYAGAIAIAIVVQVERRDA